MISNGGGVELAKVDPAVSVVCDVQNTLVNTLFMRYGNQHLRDTYLSRLSTDTVITNINYF